jgi:hypothetical protein
MPAKGFQLRSMHPHPDRSVAFQPKPPPPTSSWWVDLPAEGDESFYPRARKEQGRMAPTLWNTVIAKEKPE